jgi:signal transduction histidine kinase/DNA-binding response OmpR family regulator
MKLSETGYVPLKINGRFFIETGAKLTNCYHRILDNEFMLGTTHGLKIFRINYDGDLKVNFQTYEDNRNIIDIVPFRKGYLFASYNSVFYMDKQLNFQLVSPNSYQCLLVENDQQVLAGNNFGLHLLTFESNSSTKIVSIDTFTKENTYGGLASNFIKSIYKDKSGIIWLGTEEGGVTKLIKRENKFNLFYNRVESSNLRNNSITCFFEDSNNNLWIGTNKNGISYFSAGNYNYNTGSKDISDSNKEIDCILSIHELRISDKSYVIAGTNYPVEIDFYNTEAEAISDIQAYKTLRRVNRPVNTMVSDEKYLWIGTIEGGIFRYNYLNDSLNQFFTRNSSTISSNLIQCLCIDSKKRMWIGTDKGLNVLMPEERDKPNPTFKVYTYSENNIQSISNSNILTIIENAKHEIWIGTLGGGLNKYIENTNLFERITTRDGLPNNNIKGIVGDENNQLWISTNNGLSCLNQEDNQITNFSISDGLQDYEFKARSCVKRKNGEILFGGNKGFNSFFPGQIKIDTTQQNLIFTSFQVISPTGNENRIFHRSQLTEFAKITKTIFLKYNENSFTAFFSALNYLAPQEIKYKYRLNGFEDNWNHINSQARFAKYTNLPPGKYTLEVLASNCDGVWMQESLKLNLNIGKPWYKTAYAYAGYILLLFALFLFFNRYTIIRNKRKQELLMEHFEKEKNEELNQLKLRFFTNISHELRTPLTNIKSYFENITTNWQSLPKEKVNKDFSVITRNVDLLLRLVSQLLDFRKLEQDKIKLKPLKGDIIEQIASITDSFSIIAANKNIDLSFQHEAVELELWFDVDKMEIIINNLLSNAIKYTNSGGKIIVRIIDLEEEVKIEIEDTGIGIPQNIQANIFDRFFQANIIPACSKGGSGIGLNLTKGLVDLHNGRIELKSIEGAGSNFKLFFKKGNNHFYNSDNQEYKVENTKQIIKKEEHENSNIEIQLLTTKHIEKTILLVEDNEDLLSFLAEKLSGFIKVEVAENGNMGLQKCLNILPDIVLSDIMMPEMNGYELCNRIKNNEIISHIPVILLTSQTNIESELHGFTCGADAYVSKPFNLDLLIARIIAILDSREKIWKKISENPFFKPTEIAFNKKDEQFLRKITSIIEEQMSKPEFSVEQLAEQYGISKINLNNKIKALTGNTSVQFIRLTRLRKAAQLLKSKYSRVSDVTYEVGYSDLQHFREHFKKQFSLSPTEYKEKYSK